MKVEKTEQEKHKIQLRIDLLTDEYNIHIDENRPESASKIMLTIDSLKGHLNVEPEEIIDL